MFTARRALNNMLAAVSIYRVFQKKVAPLKLFEIFSLRLSLFERNLAKFVGSSYPHMPTNFF